MAEFRTSRFSLLVKHSILSFLFFPSAIAYCQPLPSSAEILEHLKKNIRVWVLHNPNTPDPDFKKVPTEGIFADTDGILLGTKNNNGMDICAELLAAIFKFPDGKPGKGDIVLQRALFQVMEHIDKPIDLRLVNDVAKPIEEKYLEQYGFYTMMRFGALTVYPGVYSAGTVHNSSGDIVIGEGYLHIYKAKLLFINLVTKLCLQNYTSASSVNVYSLQNLAPSKTTVPTDKILCTFPDDDTRNLVPNAIANSMAIYTDSSKRYEDAIANKWLADTPYIILPEKGAGKLGVPVIPDIPDKDRMFTLLSQKKSPSFELSPHLNASEIDRTRGWKIYPFRELQKQLVLRNEFVLGLYCYEIINHVASRMYWKFIAMENKRLWQAPPENQLAILVENFCKGLLDGKTLEDFKTRQPKNKSYLFPLALLDMFLDFPEADKIRAEFPTYKRTFLGMFPEDVFSQPILNEYFDLRAQVISAARKYNTKPDKAIIFSGERNYSRVDSGIWFFLSNIP